MHEQIIPQANDRGEVTYLFGLVMDITERMSLREQLQFMLHNDPVTTLPNQHKLFIQLDKLTEFKHHHFAIFCVSLNNFEWYNNSLGLLIGEKLLKNVANKLIECLPKGATLYKTKLNEFVCTIENYDNKSDVLASVEKILNLMKETLVINDYQINLQTSVGVSFFPENGEDKHDILRHTQSALYHAKQPGEENVQLYSADQDIYSLKKSMLHQDLMNATKEKEFELYFQPIVNATTGEIVWSEALIRWNHKKWGQVSPREFIPLAEECHLIHDITDWTIHETCSQLSEWLKKEKNVRPISINISPLRFLKKDFVEVMEKALNSYQIPSKYIILEITESVIVSREHIFNETLQSMKRLGIKIALDDFGTGYASFQYLHQYDFDIIKIDRSFIYHLQINNQKESAIIISMIKLAKSLNMLVVAEGIEEKTQLEFLRDHGCQLIQGYIYAQPLPMKEYTELLKVTPLKPQNVMISEGGKEEQRKYVRFHFPGNIVSQMNISELNNKKVDVGFTNILVNNISLGGLKFYSYLKLPVNPKMTLTFNMKMMGTAFSFKGNIVWVIEETAGLFSYGVSFTDITEQEKDQLEKIIHQMTSFQNMKEEIPDTLIIKTSPINYLKSIVK